MTRNFLRFSPCYLLVTSVVLGCSTEHSAHRADAGPDEIGTGIGREADPVVLTDNDLELLVGRDPENIVAFRYQDAWERVPVQVDERVAVDLADVY
jgi:hypothetical protein